MFQSTHPHGVRLLVLRYLNLPRPFQSTHPHGVRLSRLIIAYVSYQGFNPRTHMGCDGILADYPSAHSVFQSTHPHGVRPRPFVRSTPRFGFQSTHPHGVRHRIGFPRRGCSLSFNPRTHMGCDQLAIYDLDNLDVSIHAPTWGATVCWTRIKHANIVSIHAPTWGATYI